EAFENWFLLFLPQEDPTVFSDGSKTEECIGYRYSIWRGGMEIVPGYGGLQSAEIFNAEAISAIEGFQRALPLADQRVPIHSCLHNTAVTRGLLGPTSESNYRDPLPTL
ncbi:hypothetical protein CDV31_016785, partial [Fusarium ambrosium]